MSEKVVRGVFDSPEEEYARKNGLRFVHDKILVARTRSETPGGYEGRIYYLCFKDSGQPCFQRLTGPEERCVRNWSPPK